MNKKSGITMVTIVLYVVIFFALTAIATGVTMAMNSSSLQDKGKIYIGEAEIKLKSNIIDSLDNSDSVSVIGEKLVFSNDDVYYFDADKKIIYKNGGILIQNVSNMTYLVTESYENYAQKLSITVNIEKYGQQKQINMAYMISEVLGG